MQPHDRRAFLGRSLAGLAALGLGPLLSARRAYAGPDMAVVQDRLQQIVTGSRLNVTAAIQDLSSGVIAEAGGDTWRYPGCTLNMLVMMSVARDVVNGAYPFEYVDADIAYTIRNSSADRSLQLLTLTGGGDTMHGLEKVNALAAELGMASTVYDHPPAFGHLASLAGGPNLTTANDANRLIAGLWNHAVLPPDWSQYLITRMTQVKPGLNYLIPAGVPKDATAMAAHKNGYLQDNTGTWVENDIGVVWSTDPAKPYAYAISMYIHDMAEEFGPELFTGQRISSLAWHWFEDP